MKMMQQQDNSMRIDEIQTAAKAFLDIGDGSSLEMNGFTLTRSDGCVIRVRDEKGVLVGLSMMNADMVQSTEEFMADYLMPSEDDDDDDYV